MIGLPGDKVEVRADGTTLVNGKPFVVEKALRPNYRMSFPVVPADSLLVLGDNRPGSCDSHQWRDTDGTPAPFVPQGRGDRPGRDHVLAPVAPGLPGLGPGAPAAPSEAAELPRSARRRVFPAGGGFASSGTYGRMRPHHAEYGVATGTGHQG